MKININILYIVYHFSTKKSGHRQREKRQKQRERKSGMSDTAPSSSIYARLCMCIGFVYAEPCNEGSVMIILAFTIRLQQKKNL